MLLRSTSPQQIHRDVYRKQGSEIRIRLRCLARHQQRLRGCNLAGDFIDWTISNTTMDQAGFNWYVESIEISGSVDEANAITMTIIEGNGAT